MWSNRNMELPPSLSDIPESERTPLVKWLLNIIAQQQVVIEQQQESLNQMEAYVGQLEQQLLKLEEELKAAKQLPKKPKIQASRLNQPEKPEGKGGKRAGSAKRSKKTSNDVDEQRVIEPLVLPEGARFNGYREYDVQDLIVKRHNIRLLLEEYVTAEGKTIALGSAAGIPGALWSEAGVVCAVPASSVPRAAAFNSRGTPGVRH